MDCDSGEKELGAGLWRVCGRGASICANVVGDGYSIGDDARLVVISWRQARWTDRSSRAGVGAIGRWWGLWASGCHRP
ncbi:hypothetical protein KCP73_15950 [Salmonella enterica subsp. enterica]|nr:hypothetical protein KCP73_15950 [Salmonella enterica subsp. enterica]